MKKYRKDPPQEDENLEKVNQDPESDSPEEKKPIESPDKLYDESKVLARNGKGHVTEKQFIRTVRISDRDAEEMNSSRGLYCYDLATEKKKRS